MICGLEALERALVLGLVWESMERALALALGRASVLEVVVVAWLAVVLVPTEAGVVVMPGVEVPAVGTLRLILEELAVEVVRLWHSVQCCMFRALPVQHIVRQG